ncbi:hypothetical protein MmiAt1_03630 [Methanimicrococcus sp. At1]|uniref:CAAX prenyl protease 2/Lysostaphin resistance protein A-like domain-containing protein n=1 Tax=Methanimicrococcus hacksteinii TaxID=3028293 RepID=A0ABU3VPI9_9EURY|nr:type II CAAX endopeptidase family protein [Methanimicrococcus sp. At1]MDV0444820.1 hypothetical protein [Methanimicrococcus sp. At1]
MTETTPGSLSAETEKTDCKTFRKNINQLSRTLFFYGLLMFVPLLVFLLFQNPDLPEEELYKTAENGWLIIAGLCLGMILILLFRKKEFLSDLTKKNKSMTARAFVALFFCFMLAQPFFFALSGLFEAFLNLFGLTNLEAIEAVSSVSMTFSMFLYASFLGPIAEEIVFRGAILRFLEKYGKVYAIVVSAILFGVFHANFTQSIFAVLVGLVLGYVAIEYSLKWAVLLHVINNFVFSDLLGRLFEYLDPSASDLMLYVIYGIFLVGGIAVLFFGRKQIKSDLSQNKTGKKVWRHTFTAFWTVVFIAFNLIMALTGITALAT